MFFKKKKMKKEETITTRRPEPPIPKVSEDANSSKGFCTGNEVALTIEEIKNKSKSKCPVISYEEILKRMDEAADKGLQQIQIRGRRLTRETFYTLVNNKCKVTYYISNALDTYVISINFSEKVDYKASYYEA